MALECSARRADGAGRYVRLDECGLAVEVDWHGGNGSPADPWRCTVTVRNDGSVAFEGVVRIDIPIRADGEPRFFLPGFMYGRNRGEAPLRTATKFPRLRDRSELPASSWWMIRGDRLSNPCALAVTRSRVVGVVSSPYLVDRGDGMLVGHEACDELPFVQYAGFSCMLPTPGIVPCDDHASVGVTIGYENAPWLFVRTDIRERPDSAEGPITLAPGGAAIMRLDVVDAPARDERAIIPVLETVYRRFHEPPRQVGAPARAIRDIAVAVDRDAWLEDEHMYAGFVFDHHSPGDEIIEGKPYMYRRLGSSSWTNGMASARWGDGEGVYEYSRHVRSILHTCVHQGEDGEGYPMWNPENHLIKFIPETEWTDPSYHLPHFYEVFAERADEADRPFWAQAAKASREYLVTACHPQTGMNPEYSNYDGTPHVDERDHWHFYSDAYRTAGNIGLDCLWNGVVPDLCDANARLQRFFLEHDRTCVYAVDGTPVDETVLHPVGFIAATAEGSLAAMHSQEPDALDNAIRWVRLLWDTPIRTGTRRYYDNFLYAFAFLALAGEYRTW